MPHICLQKIATGVLMRLLILLALFILAPLQALACDAPLSVCQQGTGADFPLIAPNTKVLVYTDPKDQAGVSRVADDFSTDIGRVSGTPAARISDLRKAKGTVVVIGTIGHNRLIDQLIREGKLNVSDIAGQWEAYVQVVVDHPTKGIDKALFIVGSDRRGAIFGAYDLSQKIGVSPWYWWADVPVPHQDVVFLKAGIVRDQPKVKYRGFFINDEEPALGNWAREKFGGINAKFYAHVFELNLRMKGNYLWPAMWGKAIHDDDPTTTQLAHDYGIIIGTSHHEPLMRAHVEWERQKKAGLMDGPWNYAKNGENLRKFWRGGIERMMGKDGPYDSLVTIGMRGDGDEPMSEGTAIELLETIVADQRNIIADVTKKPADQTPQIWALYKEVQDYYDHGMEVPDDVLLLFSDDNWGQIRRLPKAHTPRKGGYGVYYHFDYVGGPRNYKWLNTNQIEKTWQQMNLAYVSGADRLWIVNVGDIKPMEYPLQFFMDMAWNPETMTVAALNAYPKAWAARNFGPELAPDVARLVTRYSQLAARKKPELIDAKSFDLRSGEWDAVMSEWEAINADLTAVKSRVTPEQQAAFFQLVEQPILALKTHYEVYYAAAKNADLVAQNDVSANVWYHKAQEAFVRDQALTETYHRLLSAGKWNHFMSQNHIGYTNWQQPPEQVMPVVTKVANGQPKPMAALTCPVVAYVNAAHFVSKTEAASSRWARIDHLGREGASMIALPQNAPASPVGVMGLSYALSAPKSGDYVLEIHLQPTLDTQGKGGLSFAVQIDDTAPQSLSFNLIPDKPDWEKAVSDNVHRVFVPLSGLKEGAHKVVFWRQDSNVILNALVLRKADFDPTQLGFTSCQ